MRSTGSKRLYAGRGHTYGHTFNRPKTICALVMPPVFWRTPHRTILESMTVSHGEIHIDWQLPEDFRVRTERLDLVPSSPELVNTGWQDRSQLSEILGARVPGHWPPELVLDSAAPEGAGW